MTGWFTEDFTFAELETLRAKERLPQVRPANTAYDGRYEIPTFAEVLTLVRTEERRDRAHHRRRARDQAPDLLRLDRPLARGAAGAHAEEVPPGQTRDTTVLIQSFEVANLRQLDTMTDVPLEQLIDSEGAPYDEVAAGDPTTYADMTTPEGIEEDRAVRRLGRARARTWSCPRDPSTGATTTPSDLVDNAHEAGLHVVRLDPARGEPVHGHELPARHRPERPRRLHAEIPAFLDAGVDGSSPTSRTTRSPPATTGRPDVTGSCG